MDEEGVAKFTLQKQLREMQNQLQEVAEDLDTERDARNKAEKQKKDLNEVGHSLICDHSIKCWDFRSVLNRFWSILISNLAQK